MILCGASCKSVLSDPPELEPTGFRYETKELYSGRATWVSEDSLKTWRFFRIYHPASESYGFVQPAAYEYKGYTSHWPGNANNVNLPTTEFWYNESLKDSITLNLDFFTESITLYRHYEDGVLHIGDTKYYRK